MKFSKFVCLSLIGYSFLIQSTLYACHSRAMKDEATYFTNNNQNSQTNITNSNLTEPARKALQARIFAQTHSSNKPFWSAGSFRSFNFHSKDSM